MRASSLQGQIQIILRSRTFARKAQLAKLLEVLAAHYDAQATLQPAHVIAELWPGDSKKGSADLAAVVTRCRRALEKYYADESAGDEILISLPRRAGEEAPENRARQWMTSELRAEREEALEVQASAEPVRAAMAPDAQPGVRRWRFTAAIGIAVVLCVLLSAAVIRMKRGDRIPSTARLDGNTLVVVNAEGKELWLRSFPDGFWGDFYADGLAPRMWFGDLDGKGSRSVLLLYHPAVDGPAHSTTLICFSEQGKEKWRWSPGRVLPELGAEPAIYHATGLAVLRARPGEPSRIVVASRHYPQYPGQVALIDSSGKTVSEYWHSGHLDYMVLADVDGDGDQKIVTLGVSNGYNQATMVVLDPRRMSGASFETARPELQIHGMGIAQERLRVLFPRSDLSIGTSRYNVGREITVGNGVIRVAIEECAAYTRCYQWYEFDTNLNLRNVYADDRFRDAHEEFYRVSDRHPFSAREEGTFWRIRCLAGCTTEFVPVAAAAQRH